MNRSNFLKSLFVLAAAPKIISQIGFAEKISVIQNAQEVVLYYYEKMAVELLHDTKGFAAYIDQCLLRGMKRHGFDLDKDFDVDIVQVEDLHSNDRRKNLVTILTQNQTI